jgi:hypothetical protein
MAYARISGLPVMGFMIVLPPMLAALSVQLNWPLAVAGFHDLRILGSWLPGPGHQLCHLPRSPCRLLPIASGVLRLGNWSTSSPLGKWIHERSRDHYCTQLSGYGVYVDSSSTIMTNHLRSRGVPATIGLPSFLSLASIMWAPSPLEFPMLIAVALTANLVGYGF